MSDILPEKAPSARKRSAFVILVRRSDKCVYCVEGHKNDIGVPGGKGEVTDFDDFTIAAREFEEETGHPLPGTARTDHPDGKVEYTILSREHFYDRVAYGDVHHNCTFFFKIVDDETAAKLTVGTSPDPQGGETAVAWLNVKKVWNLLRRHIQKGIAMVQSLHPAFLSPSKRVPVRRWRENQDPPDPPSRPSIQEQLLEALAATAKN